MKPVCRENYKFCQEICIPCYQTDRLMLLRPASFMDMAQELAFWAAHALGFGYDTLHIHHTAWVLSRMHIHFYNRPKWRDPVSLYTWHKGSNGLFYLRDFEMLASDKSPFVQATSSWVIIDEQTRRFVRPEEVAEQLSIDYEVDDAIAEPAPKVVLPRDAEAEPAGEHVVAYSDIDLIGHTNNARYVVWAMDALPLEEAARPLKDLYINFNRETTPGETVQLFRLQQDQTWYVEGRAEGKPCFVLKMEY